MKPIFIITTVLILIISFIITYISLNLNFSKSNFSKSNFEKIQSTTKFSQKIPKIIWQIAKDKNMAKLYKNHSKKIRKLNPDYNYIIFYEKDAEKFILKYYNKYILNAFNSINECYGPAKGDLLRYLLIYQFGGVYFDLKSGTNTSLNKIINKEDEFLYSSWPGSYNDNLLKTGFGEFQQWWLISIPKHPLLKNIIKSVVENIYNKTNSRLTGKFGVIKITGPFAYTLALKEYIANNPNHNLTFKPNNFDYNFSYNILNNSHNYTDDHIRLNKNGHYTNYNKPVIDQKLLYNLNLEDAFNF